MDTLARYEYSETRVRELYRVQCPTMIKSKEHGVIWMEMYGPEQPVRAIAFHIKGHPDLKNRRTMQSLTNLQYYSDETGKTSMLTFHPLTISDYKMITLTQGHDPGFMTMLFIHPWFSRLEQRFILGGTVDEPSEWFACAFQNVVPIPFMVEWTTPLWKAGISNSLLTRLDSDGMVWEISTKSYQWQRLVERMIQKGQLNG